LVTAADTLRRACEALSAQDKTTAEAIVSAEFPFKPAVKSDRKYTETETTALFLRDGFVDRYSGDRLIYPPVLRLISLALPSAFPYHPNWKMDQCHIAYWALSPTVDHIIPVSRGGDDDAENWATTSMLRNSSKSNWLLEEINWSLHPRGKLSDWDGMFYWFLSHVSANPNLLEHNFVKRWHSAAAANFGKEST
jgi:hypothetical protein